MDSNPLYIYIYIYIYINECMVGISYEAVPLTYANQTIILTICFGKEKPIPALAVSRAGDIGLSTNQNNIKEN